MNKLKLFLLAALALLGTGALAQNPLSEAVASGNKVYFEIINDAEHPIPEDEIEDVTRELINAGAWKQVSEPEDADFIMQVMAKKRVVFNSPRTWLTPSILDLNGHVPHLAYAVHPGLERPCALGGENPAGRRHDVQWLQGHEHLHQESDRKELPGRPFQEGGKVIRHRGKAPGFNCG